MILYEAINILRDKILDLPFIEKDIVAGLVKPVFQYDEELTKNGIKQIIKSFPVSCDTNYVDCFNSSSMPKLIPSTGRTNLVYFERLSPSKTRQDEKIQGFTIETTRIRAVFWFDMHRLGITTCHLPKELVQDCKNAILGYVSTIGIQFTTSNEHETIDDFTIFDQYTYDNQIIKNMMKPYAFFAVDFDIFIYNDNCLSNFIKQSPIIC